MSGADRDTREAFVAPSYDRSAFEAYSARESTRRYREANPEKVREARRRYKVANREKVRAATKRWKEANRDKQREYQRRCYQKHRTSTKP